MQVKLGDEVQGRAAGLASSVTLVLLVNEGGSGSSQVSLDTDASLSSAPAALRARGTCDPLHSVKFSNMFVIHGGCVGLDQRRRCSFLLASIVLSAEPAAHSPHGTEGGIRLKHPLMMMSSNAASKRLSSGVFISAASPGFKTRAATKYIYNQRIPLIHKQLTFIRTDA